MEFENRRWSSVVGPWPITFGVAMATSSAISTTLTAQFRYIVLLLWVLACAVLGWVGLTEGELVARLLFGVPSLVVATLLMFFLREESRLASNHLLVTAEVECGRRWGGRRRGTEVKYHFVALDGRTYEQTANVFGRREFKPKDAIPILYNPLMPTKNKPLSGFIFYRFEACS